MPTVDDLVISLTIDSTSNLGKLKKQLDALVGVGAGGVPEIPVADVSVPNTLIEDVTYIRESVGRLLPTITADYRDIVRQAYEAKIDNRNLIDLTEQLVVYFKQSKMGKDWLKERFGLDITASEEELDKAIRDYLDVLNIELGKIGDMASEIRDPHRLLKVMREIFADLGSKTKNIADVMNEIDKAFGEPQILMENAMQKLGFLKDIQPGRAILEKDFLEKTSDKIDDTFLDQESKFDKYFEDQKSTLRSIREIEEDEGKEFKEMQEEDKEEIIRALLRFHKDLSEDTTQVTTMLVDVWNYLKDTFGIKTAGLAIKRPKREDLLLDLSELTSEQLESFKKLFTKKSSEDLEKIIVDPIKEFTVELKPLLSGSYDDIAKLEEQARAFGERMILMHTGLVGAAKAKVEEFRKKYGVRVLQISKKEVLELLGKDNIKETADLIMNKQKQTISLIEEGRDVVKELTVEELQNLREEINENLSTLREERDEIKQRAKDGEDVTEELIEIGKEIERSSHNLRTVSNGLEALVDTVKIPTQSIHDLLSSTKEFKELTEEKGMPEVEALTKVFKDTFGKNLTKEDMSSFIRDIKVYLDKKMQDYNKEKRVD